MVKLRRNHHHVRTGSSMVRVILFALFFIAGMIFLYKTIDVAVFTNTVGDDSITLLEDSVRHYIPKSNLADQVVHHRYFSLGYDEESEQAEWVAYPLTSRELKMPNVERAKRFKPDPLIRSGSAVHSDYSRSGYTRGHLAPAGDMAFSKEAMEESFYMSNMSPQLAKFNAGIWNELESQVRKWAQRHTRLYIVTGPVLNPERDQKIKKKNSISIPGYFYKALLDIDGGKKNAIAFVIPHEVSDNPLMHYAVTIDSLEKLTGLGLFDDFLEPKLEERLESQVNEKHWPIDDQLYRLRVEQWNKR